LKLQNTLVCAQLPFVFNINAAENTPTPIENNLAYSVYAGITAAGDEWIYSMKMRPIKVLKLVA
jgi:hypothetical protein